MRIGEISRRAGVPPATLRAWERRYEIVRPERTEAGYRLYGTEDERRLREMVDLIGKGVAPAEAARKVLGRDELGVGPGGSAPGEAAGAPAGLEQQRDALLAALVAGDEPATHRIFDNCIAACSVDTLVARIVVPVLSRIGESWSRGELSVAGEHLASNLIRARLQPLTRGWTSGTGPLALLACPPGEQHDLPLLCFGLLLRERGWRVALLGADTPIESIEQDPQAMGVDAVVLAVSTPDVAASLLGRRPPRPRAPLHVGGGAASPELAAHLGASLLPADLLAGADRVAARV